MFTLRKLIIIPIYDDGCWLYYYPGIIFNDMTVSGTTEDVIVAFKARLCKTFDMKDFGDS